MAKVANFRLEYIGAIEVEANRTYNTLDIGLMGADILILKTRSTIDNPIRVSVNNSVAFPISYDEYTAIDGTTSLNFVFNKKCIIALAKDLDLA